MKMHSKTSCYLTVVALTLLGSGCRTTAGDSNSSDIHEATVSTPELDVTTTKQVPVEIEFFPENGESDVDDCTKGLQFQFDRSSQPHAFTIEGLVWNEPNCDYYDQVPRDPLTFYVQSVAPSAAGTTEVIAMSRNGGRMVLVQDDPITSRRWHMTLTGVPPAADDHTVRDGVYVSRVHN